MEYIFTCELSKNMECITVLKDMELIRKENKEEVTTKTER